MPLPISVIIPTYRRPELTAQAVLSVYLQTQQPQEIIVLDDYSSPTEFAQLQMLCCQIPAKAKFQLQKQPKLHLETLRRHLGMPGAVRNIGITRASQSWLAFLDSDDVWLPFKLEQQWQRAQQSRAKIIHCRELWLRFSGGKPTNSPKQLAPYLNLLLPPSLGNPQAAAGQRACMQIVSQKKHKHPREGAPQQLYPHALKKCILGPSTLLLHRSACAECGYFDPKIQIAEDYEYFLRLIARWQVAYCPEYLVAKRDCIPRPATSQSVRCAPCEPSYPQLSQQHPRNGYCWIEPLRIAALEKLLRSPRGARLFTAQQHAQAIAELQRKLSICLAGACKRAQKITALNENTEISREIQSEIQKLEQSLTYWQTIVPANKGSRL